MDFDDTVNDDIYKVGFNNGYNFGYQKGVTDGTESAAKKSYMSAYLDGFRDGVVEGYKTKDKQIYCPIPCFGVVSQKVQKDDQITMTNVDYCDVSAFSRVQPKITDYFKPKIIST